MARPFSCAEYRLMIEFEVNKKMKKKILIAVIALVALASVALLVLRIIQLSGSR